MDSCQKALTHCTLCPRECGVDRTRGVLGYCRNDSGCNVASICIHKGEEPVISGEKGICNVFFNHCNMQCSYCQNYQISSKQAPKKPDLDQWQEVVENIAAILSQGITAVGFVTPSHQLPQMKRIMKELQQRGHQPTYVFNTNAYDKVRAIAELENLIDVYLPDLKYAEPELAYKYSGAADYPEIAGAAIKEMFAQKGPGIKLDEKGNMQKGMIIRHLVLPGHIENSLECLRFIARELSPEIHISLMSQYAPTPLVKQDPEMGRVLRPEEYEMVLQEMDRLGMTNGWIQALESAGCLQPDFSQTTPFTD
ncbi:radical SAM protein [bacterium]|nr:radical SAM protein [bacterium]